MILGMVLMAPNVGRAGDGPRIAFAVAVGIAAALAPGGASRLLLLSIGAGLLVTVTTGYCPMNAWSIRSSLTSRPQWQTPSTVHWCQG
jgi:DUF2892 family protein